MFGTVANPVRMMMQEHEGAGEALRGLRSVTADYKVPEDACISYRTLYRGTGRLRGRSAPAHPFGEQHSLSPRRRHGSQAVTDGIQLGKPAGVALRSLKYLVLSFFVYAVASMSAGAIARFLGPYGLIVNVRMLNFFRYLGPTTALIILGGWSLRPPSCRTSGAGSVSLQVVSGNQCPPSPVFLMLILKILC